MPKPPSIKVGDVFKTKRSGDIEVVEYNGCKDVKVRFINTGNFKTVRADQIHNCSVCDQEGINLSKLTVGSIHPTARNGKVQIVEYKNFEEITIVFLDTGLTKVVGGRELRKGYVTPPK